MLALFGCLPAAGAQDAGYSPPPMFEDLTPPMVRPETTTGNIVEPRASSRDSVQPSAPVTTTTTTAPVSQAPVLPPQAPQKTQPVADVDTRNVVKPVSKPMPPQKAAVKEPAISTPVITPPRKPGMKPVAASSEKAETPIIPVTPAKPETPAAPIPPKPEGGAAKKQAVPEKIDGLETEAPQAVEKPETKRKKAQAVSAEEPRTVPVKRNPRQSAIKGPKTMPALPSASVDVQKTFEGDNGAVETETMLQRRQNEVAAQKETEEKREKPLVPAPKANVPPARFAKSDEGALKKTIPFRQGQIGLSSEDIDPVAVTVNQELDADGHEEWRVQIRSYATSYGTGVSSDKRIALSRALSLRTALIAQGVPAARIDVLAEGQSGEKGKQPDRIDIYLYGPAQK